MSEVFMFCGEIGHCLSEVLMYYWVERLLDNSPFAQIAVYNCDPGYTVNGKVNDKKTFENECTAGGECTASPKVVCRLSVVMSNAPAKHLNYFP